LEAAAEPVLHDFPAVGRMMKDYAGNAALFDRRQGIENEVPVQFERGILPQNRCQAGFDLTTQRCLDEQEYERIIGHDRVPSGSRILPVLFEFEYVIIGVSVQGLSLTKQ